MSTPKHRPRRPQVHRPGMNPIQVGPIEVAAEDGQVTICLGDNVVALDRRTADDLLHAVTEAMEATR